LGKDTKMLSQNSQW